MGLPKHIIKATEENKTSIGDNPCLPPEEESKFITKLLEKYFNEISEKFNDKSEDELLNELSELLIKTKQIEKNNIPSLQDICLNSVNELFKIPADTLDIICKIVNKVNCKNERLIPEKNIDFSFDSIDDMNHLTNEIYKRRVLNALILGAALYYAKNFKPYFQKVFEIDPELPLLYKKIVELNEYLMYLTKDSLNNDNANDGGKVDVEITSTENLVKIKSEGIIFPILLSETIKGVLELAISHGLPEEKEKAIYVMSKSDFKLAEIWDARIGCPLWKQIVEEIKNLGYDEEEIGINFILMYFSLMGTDEFNLSMREIFAHTKKGQEILKSLLEDITYNKEKDNFNDYINVKNSEYNIINDEDMFLPEELIVDSEC